MITSFGREQKGVCLLLKKVETYMLDGGDISGIPEPHDCVIEGIRQEGEFLIIEFEDDISYHESIEAIHPEAQTLTLRFHLEGEGLEGVFHYRRSKLLGDGYMRIKEFEGLQKLIQRCVIPATYLCHYVAFHQVIVELDANDSTLLMINADSVEFEWTLKDPSETEDETKPVP